MHKILVVDSFSDFLWLIDVPIYWEIFIVTKKLAFYIFIHPNLIRCVDDSISWKKINNQMTLTVVNFNENHLLRLLLNSHFYSGAFHFLANKTAVNSSRMEVGFYLKSFWLLAFLENQTKIKHPAKDFSSSIFCANIINTAYLPIKSFTLNSLGAIPGT